jgi:predicted kinase
MTTVVEFVNSGVSYKTLQAYVPKTDEELQLALEWAWTNIPGIQLLATTPQDAYYHAEGDVWTHTKMVCKALIALTTYQNADEQGKFVMWYAALLHDLTKPLCTIVQEDGRITSAGHSKSGATDARIFLWGAQVPFETREAICNIIAVHQVPFFAFKDKTRSPEFIVYSLSWQLRLDWLIAVARADMIGRVCEEAPQCLQDIELFEMLAEESECLTTPRVFPDEATRLAYFQSNGAIHADTPFFRKPGPVVYVLSGLPASGKNTWVNQYAKDLPVLSFDDAKEAMGLKQGDNVGKAVHFVIDQAKEYLRQGKSFVWNATHLSKQMRDKSLDLIHRYGAVSHIVYIEQPWPTLKKRNDERDTTLPSSKILEMTRKWEVPSYLEAHQISHMINHS